MEESDELELLDAVLSGMYTELELCSMYAINSEQIDAILEEYGLERPEKEMEE